MISQFDGQNLANTAWALAKLLVEDCPLLQAIASSARRTINVCQPQELANIAWSFAALVLFHDPLSSAISS